MGSLQTIKERFLKDDISFRLGGLASNLRRINSFITNGDNRDAVKTLIEESKYFIEWTAAETSIDTAAELVEIQVNLARLLLNWSRIWTDTDYRNETGEQSLDWSDRVLELSGLLNQ